MQLWFAELSAVSLATQASANLAAAPVSVAVQVPTRFITDLGAPFPATAFIAALSNAAASNAFSVASIIDVSVCVG